MRRTFLSFVVLMFVGTATAHGLVHFGFEQKYFSDPPQPVLDHCLLEKDGVIHLFYLRGNPALSIGHATTTDLINWTMQPPKLSTGTWDDRALWAPDIFKLGGTYYMFYTGVNLAWAQQSGVAFSVDLNNWIKYPNPVYHPDPAAWALWSDDTFAHGRDPHILEWNGEYYQFLTAKDWAGNGAVAVGKSSDLVNWVDQGPAYVHYNWHVLESVFIKERNDKFHMFFTEEAVNGTSHMTSDSPIEGWDIVGRTIIDIGHAPQVSDINNSEIFSRHNVYNDNHGNFTYFLRFDTLSWIGDQPAVQRPWALEKNWDRIWGSAFTTQPVFQNNPYARGENVDTTHVGNCWIGSKEAYTGPMGFGFPGAYQGDSRTGLMRSITFTIGGNSMNLLVGGGNYPNTCYVALKDAISGEILYRETGKNQEEMDLRKWNLVPYRGRKAYIEILDNETGVFGHINVDEIRESSTILNPVVGDGDTRDQPWSVEVVVGQPELLANHPNPFNPTTNISFVLQATAHVRIDVFDVKGSLVARVADGRYRAGRGTVTWDGRDHNGSPMASGVYLYRMTADGNTVATRKMLLLK